MDALLTIGAAAKTIGVPTSTLRHWVISFPEPFSEYATPEPNKTRLFAPEDLEVAQTIKFMRAERLSTEEIAERLARGERRLPDKPAVTKTGETPAEEPPPEPETGRYTELIAELVDRLQRVTERAVIAEERLRLLQSGETVNRPVETAPAGDDVSTTPPAENVPTPENARPETAPDEAEDRPVHWRKRLGRWIAGE